jgi:hypothetical protein
LSLEATAPRRMLASAPWNCCWRSLYAKRAVPQPPPKMRERIKMLAPTHILHDSGHLLGDVRSLLSVHPALLDYPRRIATLLGVSEVEVLFVLEALRVEGEVLA